MFPLRYWANRFFNSRYWPNVGAAAAIAVVTQRFGLEGTSTTKFSLHGANNSRFALAGTSDKKFWLTGTDDSNFALTGTTTKKTWLTGA